jgi:hypothetical protein
MKNGSLIIDSSAGTGREIFPEDNKMSDRHLNQGKSSDPSGQSFFWYI